MVTTRSRYRGMKRRGFGVISDVGASEFLCLVGGLPFFQLRCSCDAGQKSKEAEASAALLGLRMLTLGPGGVAAEGGWSISC